MKKILSVFLALCLLLCGCASRDEDSIRGSLSPMETPSMETHTPETPLPAQTEEPQPQPDTPAERGYFPEVWRGDVDYTELSYEPYDLAWFDEYTRSIYELAEKGGSVRDFGDADFYLTDELYYVYTMMQLADLAWCRDPSDESLTQQLTAAEECFYAAYDEYFKAMNAMANSEHSDLMEQLYHESYISYFASYDPEFSAQDSQNLSYETQLITEYYALMSQETVDRDAVAQVYVELVQLRNAVAEAYGYDSYADYAYESLYYRDYYPEDSAGLYEGIKKNFAPLLHRYEEKGWDSSDRIMASGLDCSPKAILSALSTTLSRISLDLSDACEYLLEYKLYDIGARPQKAQLGFTTTLYYYNQPFIFNAAGGEFYDYMDTIHEFGHFANAYANSADLIFGMADMDLSELQSQGLELLFTRYYDDIFGECAGDAEAYTLLSMLYSVVDGAMYDEFQQRVYAEEGLTAQRVNEIYAQLYTEYGYTPYPGYESEWMDVVHNFEQPFYYISYCVSALAALEIYQMMQTDWDAAVDTYLKVCAMNTEYYYFSEALDEAGLDDIFDTDGYAAIARSVDNALK